MPRVASRRLRAGIGSRAEEIRAGVQVDVAEVEREHTEHELATARQNLAAFWSGEAPRFDGQKAISRGSLPCHRWRTSRNGSKRARTWRAGRRSSRSSRRARARSGRKPDVT
jgi:hypothetical protein